MGTRSKTRYNSESSQASICLSCGDEYCQDISINPAFNGGRRNTKQSISDCLLIPSQIQEFQSKYSEIALSYHKVKIAFVTMLILNIVLIAALVVCAVFIMPNINMNLTTIDPGTKASDNGILSVSKSPVVKPLLSSQLSVEDDTSSITDRHVMKCETLQSQLGAVYINGQKSAALEGKNCSLVDVVESIVQHTKVSRFETARKAAFHFTTDNEVLAGCNKDSRMLKCFRNWNIQMNTTNISVEDDSIIVPKDGVFFIYNRVTIHMDDPVATEVGHSLRYSDSGRHFHDLEINKISCQATKERSNEVSYIEKVQHLKKGGEIKIALKTYYKGYLAPIKSSSAFGMFEL